MIKPLLSGLALVTLCACAEQSAPSNYLCDETLSASIVEYNDEEARLTFKESEFLLNRQVSGSGVKYSADNVLFWSKGDEAMLILKGKKYQCSLTQQ